MSYWPFIFFLTSVLYLNPGLSSAIANNCDDLIIEYTVDDCDPQTNNGKINLTVKEGSFPITFKLFDLHGNSYEFLQERTVYSNSDQELFTFDALPESDYVIQVINDNCTRTLGGIEGIKISRKQ